MHVDRYTKADEVAWDAAVVGARQRHFLFQRGYMDYHADRFTDASLIVRDGESIVGVLPASRHGDEVVSHGGLTFGTLLTGPGVGVARTVAAYQAIAAALRADGVRTWHVKPLPHIYHLLPAEEDLFALFVLGAVLTRREVSAAVSRHASAGYSSERRRAIKRAQREDLQIGQSTAFAEFMALEREILRSRHQTEPVHSDAEISMLAQRFPGEIRLHEVRDDRGELVAGVIVYLTPAVAHAQYIGASDRGRELRAQDALFERLLNETYAEHPWFDFGISNHRDGTLNDGLMRNKEGFGARAVIHDRYAIDLR